MTTEKHMQINLSNNDLREIRLAVRQRAQDLRKEAEKLTKLDRMGEAENLSATADDLSQRLCTLIAEALEK